MAPCFADTVSSEGVRPIATTIKASHFSQREPLDDGSGDSSAVDFDLEVVIPRFPFRHNHTDAERRDSDLRWRHATSESLNCRTCVIDVSNAETGTTRLLAGLCGQFAHNFSDHDSSVRRRLPVA